MYIYEISIARCPNLEARREECVEEGIYTGITVGKHMGTDLQEICIGIFYCDKFMM